MILNALEGKTAAGLWHRRRTCATGSMSRIMSRRCIADRRTRQARRELQCRRQQRADQSRRGEGDLRVARRARARPAIGPRERLIDFVDGPARATICATRSTRARSGASSAGSRARPSRPGCARRCDGISTIEPGGSASATASTAASGWASAAMNASRLSAPAASSDRSSSRRRRSGRRSRCARPAPRLRRRRRSAMRGARIRATRQPGDRGQRRRLHHSRPSRERARRRRSRVNALGAGDARAEPAQPRRSRSSISRPTTCSTARRRRRTSRAIRSRRSAPMALPSGGRAGGPRRHRAARDPAHIVGLRRARRQFRQDDAAPRRERDELSVVADQRGCPTATRDLADAISRRPPRSLAATGRRWGTYHFAGAGETNWHGFAQEIFERGATLRRPAAESRRSRRADYPTPARRPPNSVLDSRRSDNVRITLTAVAAVACAKRRRLARIRRRGEREGHHPRRRLRHAAAPDHAGRHRSSCCRSTTSR